MHLSAAKIDLDGCVVAEGDITFPSDQKQIFVAAQTNTVRLRAVDGGWTELQACTALRDPQSGFLRCEGRGPFVQMPHPFGHAVFEALRRPPRRASVLQCDIDGFLTLRVNEQKSYSQRLTDWSMEIDQLGSEELFFTATAKLRAKRPDEVYVWEKYENYWQEDTSAETLSLQFKVDPISRVAAFGGYSNAIGERGDRTITKARASALNDVRLSDAPVGFNNTVFGVDRRGQWVRFYETSKQSEQGRFASMSFEQPVCAKRYESGLMESGDYSWPRVTFRGLDLGLVRASMIGTTRFSLLLPKGFSGQLYWGGPDGHRNEKPMEARLSFELTMRGLEIGYEALFDPSPREGALVGELTLPWEVLILRYPEFLSLRRLVQEP